MIEQHGKGLATLVTTAGGFIVAWLPVIDTVVRIGSGIAAIIAGTYTALYFRKQWKRP